MARTKTQTDDDLLAVARGVFLREGHGASTRMIAKETGLSESVLYQRFGTKDVLFFRAMIPDATDVAALVCAGQGDAKRQLHAIGTRLVTHFADLLPLITRVIIHPGLSPERMQEWHGHLPFPRIVRALSDQLAAWKDAGLVGDIEPGAAALSFVASMLSTALLETLSGALPEASRAQRVAALVEASWIGLAPRG